MQRRKIARGETIWLNDMPGPEPTQTFPGLATVPADLSPNAGKDQKARHMRTEYPPPRYPFAYRKPPVSGNVINGLGEKERRRAGHVFFGDAYKRAWGKLDWYFHVMESTNVHRVIVGIFWQDRRRVGPVAKHVTAPSDPVEAAARVKDLARKSGAALVGITELTDELRYEGFDTSFKYSISIAIPMDRDEMVHAPSNRACLSIMHTYKDVNRVAIEVAEAIRVWGWPAHASTNLSPDAAEVLHVPTAIQAGLGQLGKHGSLITPEYGSNVRLVSVLTDIPLSVDAPMDLGVDDFCATCRVCETNCPPHALFPEKQLVRGVERWHVDFDKCAPYFAENHSCGICIQVCPWSEPGRGVLLAERLLRRRATHHKITSTHPS